MYETTSEAHQTPSGGKPGTGIDLYWIPVGAGGVGFVRLNGRIYEWVKAIAERRGPIELFHTALELRLDGERFTVENAWPMPGGPMSARGVVVVGPVFGRRIARLRPFRYEIRCWRNGVIPDAQKAVASPQSLSTDPKCVARLLAVVDSVPPLTWGRDEMRTGEMWNSNSVIAWLIARSGLSVDSIQPPVGGRAPGWGAGLVVAGRG